MAKVRSDELTNHSFTLIIEGVDIMSADVVNALYDAGCDDATFGVCEGVQDGGFDREAGSFAEAVGSAIADVEGALPGARVVKVIRDAREEAEGVLAAAGVNAIPTRP